MHIPISFTYLIVAECIYPLDLSDVFVFLCASRYSCTRVSGPGSFSHLSNVPVTKYCCAAIM